MVPYAVVVLDAFPVTAQGKTDPRALPAPGPRRGGAAAGARPRNAVEAQVAEIWAEVLSVSDVGLSDDFFRVGGHSLAAVRLLSRVRERFGRGVALPDFMANPTVAHMASLLAATTPPDTRAPARALIDLTRGGTSTMVCVHPIGGSAACYLELARWMGRDCTVKAFQAGGGTCHSLDTLAHAYVTELRREVGDGPVRLCGWSFGGLLAYEMARQLEADGVRVDLLAMLDTYPPREARGLESGAADDESAVLLRAAAGLVGTLAEGDPANRAGEQEAFVRLDPARQKAALREALRRHGLIGASEADFSEALVRVARHARAADAYEVRPIRSPIDLFVAHDGEPGMLAAWWGRWTSGGLRVHDVPGDHDAILRPPAVRDVAATLAALIAAPIANLSR